jgi:hypothetical protein
MRLFEIILPRATNNGLPYDSAHQAYARWLLDCFGGLTRVETVGLWRGEGQTYTDTGFAYRVATEFDQRDEMVRIARGLFPDQEAFFIAEIGTAEIR